MTHPQPGSRLGARRKEQILIPKKLAGYLNVILYEIKIMGYDIG